MNTAIQLHQNDAGLILSFNCRDEDGQPIDLTQHTVDFFMYDGDTLINEGHTQCDKPNAPMGIAEYTMIGQDTTAAGIFRGVLRLQNSIVDARNIGDIPVHIRQV